MTVLGLSGWASSGKDQSAKYLSAVYGFERVAFADRMRSALLALDPIAHVLPRPDGYRFPQRLSDLVNKYGWDEAKRSFPEVRALLQRFGTDCVRHHLGDDTWVNATLSEADPSKRYVVTDVRFQNEARAIRDLATLQRPADRIGFMVRITRPGHGPANDHISEHDLNDYAFDYRLMNNGTIADLEIQIDEMLEQLAPNLLQVGS